MLITASHPNKISQPREQLTPQGAALRNAPVRVRENGNTGDANAGKRNLRGGTPRLEACRRREPGQERRVTSIFTVARPRRCIQRVCTAAPGESRGSSFHGAIFATSRAAPPRPLIPLPRFKKRSRAARSVSRRTFNTRYRSYSFFLPFYIYRTLVVCIDSSKDRQGRLGSEAGHFAAAFFQRPANNGPWNRISGRKGSRFLWGNKWNNKLLLGFSVFCLTKDQASGE